MDRLTRDVAGEVAREEGSYVGYVLRRTATTEGDLYFPLLANLFRECTRHIGDDEARSDSVGTDTASAELLCDALCQTDHTSLRSGVVRLTCVARDTDDAGHVDDATATLLDHDGGDSVDEVEGTLEVDVDDEVPLLFGHTHHQPVTGDTSVVDEDVDTAEVCDDCFDELVSIFEVSCVRGISLSLDTEPFELLDEGFYSLVDLEVSDHYGSTFLCILECNSAADTTACAGDDGYLVSK